jgi:hypothetical protein
MRSIRFLAPLLALLLWSQNPLPDTPAGRCFGEWLQMFNRGERAAAQQFFEKYSPGDAQRADRSLQMRQQNGGFDLQKVEASSVVSRK